MAEHYFEVRDLNVKYGGIQVIWDESFYVDKGEIIAIVGSNGAGKSTTVKSCSGLVKPVSGSICIEGRELCGQPSRRFIDQGVVLVPEGRQLFPDMSVLENLEMGASSAQARAHVRENVEKVFTWFPKLKERTRQLGGSLSGGEQQMVAFSRGMMAMPKLLIMDEPSLGLAPAVVDEIFRICKEISTSEGLTVVLVEQDVRKALHLADRGYVLENGRITLSGKAAELIANPDVKKAYLGI